MILRIRQQHTIGYQIPFYFGDLPLTRFRIEPDHGLEGLWRRIVDRSQFGIIKHIGIVGAEPFRDPLLVRPPSIPAAHGIMLLRAPPEPC